MAKLNLKKWKKEQSKTEKKIPTYTYRSRSFDLQKRLWTKWQNDKILTRCTILTLDRQIKESDVQQCANQYNSQRFAAQSDIYFLLVCKSLHSIFSNMLHTIQACLEIVLYEEQILQETKQLPTNFCEFGRLGKHEAHTCASLKSSEERIETNRKNRDLWEAEFPRGLKASI